MMPCSNCASARSRCARPCRSAGTPGSSAGSRGRSARTWRTFTRCPKPSCTSASRLPSPRVTAMWAASLPRSNSQGRSSQLTSPTAVPCTVRPVHTPLQSEPSTPAQEQPRAPLAGMIQAAGRRARRMAAKTTAASSAIQIPRLTSTRVQDDGGVHQSGRIGLFNAGRLHADAVLLGETAEPADQRIEGRLGESYREAPGSARLAAGERARQTGLARRTVDDHEQRFSRGCRRGGGGGQFGGYALHPGEIGVLAGEALVRMRDAAIEGNHHAEEEDRRREREAPREQAPLALGKGGEGVERQ